MDPGYVDGGGGGGLQGIDSIFAQGAENNFAQFLAIKLYYIVASQGHTVTLYYAVCYQYRP